MSMGNWIGIAVLVFVIGYMVMIYNNLVRLKHAVSKYLANIDVLLKQRHDELPKLVETCNRYMTHEKETLNQITEARSRVSGAQQSGDVGALGIAETALRAGLGQLFAVVENYPDLKADQSFQHLQQRISDLENAISDRREVYNEAVNNNNVRIEQFPDVVIANFFGFKAFELLEFEDQELADVSIKELFS